MLRAGANRLPSALLCLALGALAFALMPRASTSIAYGLVGAALRMADLRRPPEVPGWPLPVSLSTTSASSQGEPFAAIAAAIMLALAALATLAAVAIFARRDLTGT